jgi:hypothetical protein
VEISGRCRREGLNAFLLRLEEASPMLVGSHRRVSLVPIGVRFKLALTRIGWLFAVALGSGISIETKRRGVFLDNRDNT